MTAVSSFEGMTQGMIRSIWLRKSSLRGRLRYLLNLFPDKPRWRIALFLLKVALMDWRRKGD